jgi:shikimate kinase
MFGSSNIFLVGPMGSGKTAVGKRVSRLLDYPFIDSDQELELRTGVDIPLIFEREGEPGFRRRERELIAELSARDHIVLATGGGAVLDPDNRRFIAERGWVVYLETSIALQVERAGRTRHRPLLQGTDPKVRLEQLMLIREPLYRDVADFSISTTRRGVGQVAERIVAAFQVAAASGVTRA